MINAHDLGVELPFDLRNRGGELTLLGKRSRNYHNPSIPRLDRIG
jgi:hypothetical protein